MTGVVLVRCQVCEQLTFDPRIDQCDNEDCGWNGACIMCGQPVTEPRVFAFCSPECKYDAVEEIHAELSIGDGGL